MSRYNTSRVITTDTTEDELLEPILDERDLTKVNHYSTPKLRHPTVSERASLRRQTHIFTSGDTLMKLADQYYGDVNLWWVLAWYNTTPTDAHLEPGMTLYIPTPLSRVLQILRSS